MKKCLICLISMILFVGGCQSPDDSSVTQEQVISIVPTVQSRAAMESGFKSGDQIGLFMLARADVATPATLTAITGNYVDNVAYTLSADGVWATISKYYWKDADSPFDVVAYYPYTNMASSTSVKAASFELGIDQSTEVALRKSDFLYGTANAVTYDNNSTGIPLSMKHKMCKITVTLSLPATVDLSTASFSIRNVAYSGTINFATGEVSSDIKTSNITPYYIADSKKLECIVVPQELSVGSDLISVAYPDPSNANNIIRLAYSMSSRLQLVSGKEYNFAFTYTEANKIRTSLTVKDLNK